MNESGSQWAVIASDPECFVWSPRLHGLRAIHSTGRGKRKKKKRKKEKKKRKKKRKEKKEPDTACMYRAGGCSKQHEIHKPSDRSAFIHCREWMALLTFIVCLTCTFVRALQPGCMADENRQNCQGAARQWTVKRTTATIRIKFLSLIDRVWSLWKLSPVIIIINKQTNKQQEKTKQRKKQKHQPQIHTHTHTRTHARTHASAIPIWDKWEQVFYVLLDWLLLQGNPGLFLCGKRAVAAQRYLILMISISFLPIVGLIDPGRVFCHCRLCLSSDSFPLVIPASPAILNALLPASGEVLISADSRHRLISI